MENAGAGAAPFVFLRVFSRIATESGEMVLSSGVVVERVKNGVSFLDGVGLGSATAIAMGCRRAAIAMGVF
jgi:hypothetical protein